MQTQAVVFDMDGVLIDSEVVWREVREAYAASLGKVWTHEAQQAAMGCNAAAWGPLMQRFLELDIAPSQVVADIKSRLLARLEAQLPLRPGALASVHALARHYRVALASGSPDDVIGFVLERTGLDRVFEAVTTGDDVAIGKPDPEIYLRTLAKLGVPPDQAVGVEDSGNGIRALHAAGMRCIAAPGPQFPVAPAILKLADVMIDSMEQLTPALVARLAATASV